MKKLFKLLIACGVFVVALIVVAVACTSNSTPTVPNAPPAPAVGQSSQQAPTPEQPPASAPTTVEYPPQVEQARGSAQSYLELKGFSRDGLIQQLSSEYGESYPKDVATQAVDSLSVDWNAQAAKAAQSYLDLKSFSCSGLTEQLSSDNGDQFTSGQAKYGAHQTVACK
jgi:hypothetical protein